MNDDEREKLEEIHSDVRETRTRVEVVDERTEHMDARMDSMQEDVNDNSDDIDKLQGSVSRNSTILGGFVTGGSAVLLWVSDKLMKII